ncbi:N-acetylglucosamine-6-phosphate deacetylase [Chromatiales bacterium (ex Bugula neritina AB1)]|nr:N-acetylglucosamine-6-phosphate deacetylase [Chromatiales bacterium (ex Bugula neritina AB1)]
MTMTQSFTGSDIFDGQILHQRSALIVRDEQIVAIVDEQDTPDSAQSIELSGGILVPGFVDLQVNGGGGILLNEEPTVEGIKRICSAHLPFGTTALLPTLITDTPQVTDAAINAGIAAHRAKVPGFIGLHLEGPHLDVTRKGAHDSALIRPMATDDLQRLIAAKNALPTLLVTVAPESITNEQISTLASAGVIVSLGHTNTSNSNATAAFETGASCVTHLFNAMSPLNHREPGLVGATLASDTTYAGLIADGFHVDKTAIAIALAAKQGSGKIFLVTDAMSTIGTDLKSFELNGRKITRSDGRLTLADGTLAGADLDMISAIRFLVDSVGVEALEAFRMASAYPSQCIRASNTLGYLHKGASADLVHVSDALEIQRVWQQGRQVFTLH